MSEITVAVYAENCDLAGELCTDEEMIERESDDLVIYRGDEEEILECAHLLEFTALRDRAHSHNHNLHVAQSLREAIGLD